MTTRPDHPFPGPGTRIAAGAVLAAALLLFCLAWGMLRTQPGRDILAALVSGLATVSDTFKVRLEGLEGRLPGEIRLGPVPGRRCAGGVARRRGADAGLEPVRPPPGAVELCGNPGPACPVAQDAPGRGRTVPAFLHSGSPPGAGGRGAHRVVRGGGGCGRNPHEVQCRGGQSPVPGKGGRRRWTSAAWTGRAIPCG